MLLPRTASSATLALKVVLCLRRDLIEPSHNARFISVMDEFLPQWRALRAQLKQSPKPLEIFTHSE